MIEALINEVFLSTGFLVEKSMIGAQITSASTSCISLRHGIRAMTIKPTGTKIGIDLLMILLGGRDPVGSSAASCVGMRILAVPTILQVTTNSLSNMEDLQSVG